MRSQPSAAARHGSILFVISGVLALADLAAPGGHHLLLLLGIAAGDLGVAGVAYLLPWARWAPSATLVLCLPALAVIGAANKAGLVPERAYGMFFVVLFVWIGIHHPPGTAFKVVPVALVGFSIPVLLGRVHASLDLRSVVLVVVISCLVAEIVSRIVVRSGLERQRAERAAASLRIVGRAIAGARHLSPEAVLDGAVEAVISLGYDGANIAVIDQRADTFEPRHCRGVTADCAGRHYPLRAGLTGMVLESGGPVITADNQKSTRSLAGIQAAGIATAVGVPIFEAGRCSAVLIASLTKTRPIQPEEVEALKLLADAAAGALTSARAFQRQLESADLSAHDAVTDDLTGLGNRRRSRQILDGLDVGDCLGLIDIDRFKSVNDTLGHSAGDRLLSDLAEYIDSHLRRPASVVRYGGEEFLLHLPATTLAQAGEIIERLMAGWRERGSFATFSAGLARHQEGDSSGTTLERADRACYRAKDLGRNRFCYEDLGEEALRPAG
ncbi:MAG: GGDEF domain-containing protein [Acidimicrobiales bacterium]